MGTGNLSADRSDFGFEPGAVVDHFEHDEGAVLPALYQVALVHEPAVGIEHVWVNGVLVVDSGELVAGVAPGRAIRGAPQRGR